MIWREAVKFIIPPPFSLRYKRHMGIYKSWNFWYKTALYCNKFKRIQHGSSREALKNNSAG